MVIVDIFGHVDIQVVMTNRYSNISVWNYLGLSLLLLCGIFPRAKRKLRVIHECKKLCHWWLSLVRTLSWTFKYNLFLISVLWTATKKSITDSMDLSLSKVDSYPLHYQEVQLQFYKAIKVLGKDRSFSSQ